MLASPGRSSGSCPLASEGSRRSSDPTTRRRSASAPSRSGASLAGRVISPLTSSWSARTPCRTGSGFGGEDAIALTLARAGWTVSARSVRRIVARAPRPSPASPTKPPHPVIARCVHHVWMMDITEVRSFLGLRVFHVASVFDAFPRVPLAPLVDERTPDAARMLPAPDSETRWVLERSVRRFGNETLGPGKDRLSRLQGILVVLQTRILADARIAPRDCVGSEPLRFEHFGRKIQAHCRDQVQQLGEVVSLRETPAARDQDGFERFLRTLAGHRSRDPRRARRADAGQRGTARDCSARAGATLQDRQSPEA